MQPTLSIIITSYKNPAILRLCIKSIRQTVKSIDYEIIVADSQTEEKTHDLMREEFSRITFLANKENRGFGSLVNQGLAKAEGKFLLIINSDIIFKEGSIKKLIDYLQNNHRVGIVGPKLISFDNTVQQSCFRFYTPMTIIYRRTFLGRMSFGKKHLNRFTMAKEQKKTKDNPIEADWIMGSAMMTTKRKADEVGSFDDTFFLYFEDVDWCRRFWEKGHEVIYYPAIKAFHYHGKASESTNAVLSVLFNKYSRIHISSALKYFKKYLGKEDPHKKYNESSRGNSK